MAKATIIYITSIPSQVVKFSVLGIGGSYNGGIKSTLTVEVDLAQSGPGSLKVLTRTWGMTSKYNDADALPVAGKPSWFCALKSGASAIQQGQLAPADDNLKATWKVPGDATHGVALFAAGGNPLLSVAPAIDGDFVLGLRMQAGKIQYRLEGEHDGFPDHVITIGGTKIYAHDCVAAGKDPSHLAPPAEVDLPSPAWKTL
jgi:hypothetical protein